MNFLLCFSMIPGIIVSNNSRHRFKIVICHEFQTISIDFPWLIEFFATSQKKIPVHSRNTSWLSVIFHCHRHFSKFILKCSCLPLCTTISPHNLFNGSDAILLLSALVLTTFCCLAVSISFWNARFFSVLTRVFVEKVNFKYSFVSRDSLYLHMNCIIGECLEGYHRANQTN